MDGPPLTLQKGALQGSSVTVYNARHLELTVGRLAQASLYSLRVPATAAPEGSHWRGKHGWRALMHHSVADGRVFAFRDDEVDPRRGL